MIFSDLAKTNFAFDKISARALQKSNKEINKVIVRVKASRREANLGPVYRRMIGLFIRSNNGPCKLKSLFWLPTNALRLRFDISYKEKQMKNVTRGGRKLSPSLISFKVDLRKLIKSSCKNLISLGEAISLHFSRKVFS